MKTKLFKGLDEDEKEQLKQDFKSSFRYRKALNDFIDLEIGKLYESMLNEGDISSAGWDKIQLEKIAQIKAMKNIQTYLN